AEVGVKTKEPIEQASDRFKGLTFVITGTFENYTRDELRNLIEKNGGTVSESVSKKTSYLLMGENPGSKAQKAALLNTPIMSEAQWQEWFKRT
ncbi:MAG TPA: NAD-dependent DNA ligase LigA, partial [Thermotogota bacterium]|nr:NAD-dependent DNA ligase LigA [Thermotogota bacterium]